MSYKDFRSNVNVLQLDGTDDTVGTPSVTVLETDKDGMVLLARGATVPTDADAGYAMGCLFIDTDASAGSVLYLNEGSATSADFNKIETPNSAITGVTAGFGLDGGGTEGTVSLAVDTSEFSGTTVVLGRTTAGTTTINSGTVVISGTLKPNSSGSLLNLGGAAGTAIMITPTGMTSLLGFSAADGAVSLVGTTSITHKIACNIAGTGVRYLHLHTE